MAGRTPGGGVVRACGPLHEHDAGLVRELTRLSGVILSSARAREPHRLTTYIYEIAGLFHKFYDKCKILGDEVDATRGQARLQLCLLTRHVVASVLGLICGGAPGSMGEKE